MELKHETHKMARSHKQTRRHVAGDKESSSSSVASLTWVHGSKASNVRVRGLSKNSRSGDDIGHLAELQSSQGVQRGRCDAFERPPGGVWGSAPETRNKG